MHNRHSVDIACTWRTCTCTAHALRAHRACIECARYVCSVYELAAIEDDATAIARDDQYISKDEKLRFLDPSVLKPPDGTSFTSDELKALFKNLAGKPASHALATT